MKLSLVIAYATICSTVSAYGPTGAAERAMLFARYLSEEIWTDSNRWTIASGCRGTREGIRKQAGRCNLAEFVDHLWMETEGPVLDGKKAVTVTDADGNAKPLRAMDARPDPQQIAKQWSEKSLRIGESDVFKAAQAIGKINVPAPGVRPAGGYTGNINAGNVLAGSTDYYEMMAESGRSHEATKAEIDRVIKEDATKPAKEKSLTTGMTKSLQKWTTQAELGASVVHEMRIKVAADYKIKGNPSDPSARSFKDIYGDVETSPHVYQKDIAELDKKIRDGNGLKPYEEVDETATVNKWQGRFESREAASKAFKDALEEYNRQPGAVTHQAAIDAAKTNAQRMGVDHTGTRGC